MALLGKELGGKDALVDGGAVGGSRGGGGARKTFFDRLGVLSVLPDLRGMRSKGEPQSDEVRLQRKRCQRGLDKREKTEERASPAERTRTRRMAQ